MTQQETTLLKRNFKMNLEVIITMLSCTVTFVWKGSWFVSEISQTQKTNTYNITKLDETVKDLEHSNFLHEIRLTKLESKSKK